MHRGHEHESANGYGAMPGAGHNHATSPRPPAQWQLLHEAAPSEPHEPRDDGDKDLDLVTAAFIDGFAVATDPTSFLRLAKVPFEATAADGAKLALLRVEIDAVTDVGAVTPHLGGASFRYDPLPGKMVSRRKRLRLVYFDGQGLRALDLAEATKLSA
jgi:hypothetical protein